MTILITGAAHALGAALTHQLLYHGHQVIALDTIGSGFLPGNPTVIPRHATYIPGNCQSQRLRTLFRRYQPKILYHLAIPHSAQAPQEVVTTAGLSTNILYSLAIELGIHTCITATPVRDLYDPAPPGPIEDHTPTQPQTIRGIHASLCETLHAYYHAQQSIRTVAFRHATLYGPYDNQPGEDGLVAEWITQGIRRHPRQIPSSLTGTRDWLALDDAATALALAATRPMQGPYLIGTGLNTSVELITTLIDALLPSPAAPWIASTTKTPPSHQILKSLRSQTETGWHPDLTLHQGISRTVATICSQLQDERPSR